MASKYKFNCPDKSATTGQCMDRDGCDRIIKARTCCQECTRVSKCTTSCYMMRLHLGIMKAVNS